MDDKPSSRREAARCEISAMMADGRMDGVVRYLRTLYPNGIHLVEDAVCEAVPILLVTAVKREVHNKAAYLTTVAENKLKRAVRRERLFEHPEEDEAMQGEVSDELNIVEARRTVELLKKHTAGWTENLRVVTDLVLDAVVADADLTSEDLAYEATMILGRSVSSDHVRVWKSRGLKKLREVLSSEESLE